jgi:multicomponent Na+:H+ antiporter subunit E
MFLLNILLAMAWVALTGEFNAGNFAIGFIIVYLLLALTRPSSSAQSYTDRVRRIFSFSLFFLKELVMSSLWVTVQVLSPTFKMTPAVVAVPLDIRSDAGITLLGNLITLTPGTLTLEVAEDHSQIFIHAMHVDDVAAFRQEIKQGFERRVIEVLQ